jgi:hypothetical protein
MAQFVHGLYLDLPNSLTRNAVDPPNLVQRARLIVYQTEPQSDYSRFTL